LIYTGLEIEKEISTAIKYVPGSIAILSKLGEFYLFKNTNLELACVSEKASKDARKLKQSLLKIEVSLFEIKFYLKLIFSK
jgi:hypothetical protein